MDELECIRVYKIRAAPPPGGVALRRYSKGLRVAYPVENQIHFGYN